MGPWEFEPIVQLLRDENWDVDAIDLPSTGSTEGLLADAAAVTAAIDRGDGPVVLVGHSYGGAPITQAGDHPMVERLVYVAAFALEARESALGAMGGALPESWGVDNGQVTMGRTHDERVELIASDMPPGVPREVSEQLATLFRPQSLRSLSDELTAVAWRSKPATYILTENDGILPAPFQEMLAARSGSDVIRIPHGHAPFQEDPAGFAALLARIAAPASVAS